MKIQWDDAFEYLLQWLAHEIDQYIDVYWSHGVIQNKGVLLFFPGSLNIIVKKE